MSLRGRKGVLIYLAGPFTLPSPAENVRDSIETADSLMRAGHFVYNPSLLFFHDLQHKRTYDYWLSHCLAVLPRMDVLVRRPGYSPGADIEVAHARALNMPVFEGPCSSLAFLEACALAPNPNWRSCVNG